MRTILIAALWMVAACVTADESTNLIEWANVDMLTIEAWEPDCTNVTFVLEPTNAVDWGCAIITVERVGTTIATIDTSTGKVQLENGETIDQLVLGILAGWAAGTSSRDDETRMWRRQSDYLLDVLMKKSQDDPTERKD